MERPPDWLARPMLYMSPPGGYVHGDDNLRVVSYNAATGVVLTIAGRFVTLEGAIVPFARTHTPNTDRTVATTDYRLGEGWLLDVTVLVSSGTPVFGQTWARLEINRSMGSVATILAVLAMGHVTATQRLVWPGQPLYTPLERAGAIRRITGTNQAAGAEIAETVPTGARWRLLSLRVDLVTSVTAGNRRPNLIFDDGTTEYYRFQSNTNHGASLTFNYCASSIGGDTPPLGLAIPLLVPENMVLRAGHRLTTATNALDAADNYGTPELLVEEWLEP